MFGIDDPGIWLAYLGVRNWNKDENDSINSKKPNK